MSVPMSAKHGRTIRSYVLSGLLLALAGIGGAVIALALRSEARHAAETSAPGLAVSETMLEHDFGILSPGQHVSHEFTLENKTRTRWTIARFQTSCQCTVSSASAKYIDPGQSAQITVLYVAPEKEGDVLQNVRVHFQEKNAPLIDLQLRAHIRQLLSVTPSELSFPRVGAGQDLTETIEIRNYSGHDLQGVKVTSSEPWIAIKSVSQVTSSADGPYAPRQVWRAGASCSTEKLGGGQHRATLKISAIGEKLEKAIPVDMVVIVPPLEAIPGQLFFGQVSARESTTKSVLLSLAPTCKISGASDVLIKHNLGNCLKISCSKVNAEYWKLNATFDPTVYKEKPTIEGSLSISLFDEKTARVNVPIYIQVRSE